MRLDKWLWAARFFKTRSMAADAVAGGKVRVREQRVKPAKIIAVGDEISVVREQLALVVTVMALSDRRGPASAAQLLYQETEASQAARLQRKAQQLPQASVIAVGRPDKKQRRQSQQLKRQQLD